MSARSWIVGGALSCLLALSPALAATPELKQVTPRGGQVGTQLELTLQGQRLFDAEELLFYRQGLSASGLKIHDKGKRVTVTLTIAPDCPLGEHALRLRCRSGLSPLATVWVGALSHRDEVEPNGDFEQPERVPLEVTIQGHVEPDDVEFFAFEGQRGQRVTAEVEAMRLGGAMFDPYLAILDERRFELASCDDAPLLGGQDGLVSLVLPADGTYVVELREAAYRGGGAYRYRLHLGTFPRPLVALPAGGPSGATLSLHTYGDVAGVDSADWVVPAGSEGLVEYWPRVDGRVAPSPLRLRRAPLPGAPEVEPNPRKQATVVSAPPIALHGRIERSGDEDWFRFSAQKDQRFRVQAWARGLGSALDPVINVFHAGGKHLKGNDDVKGDPDSAFTFKVPEDGDYELRVKDFLRRGSEAHTYRVEVTPLAPRLELGLKTYGRNKQDRNAVAVPRGNRFATLVQVTRRDFNGPVALELDGLPAGISAVHTATCNPGYGWVPVVFEAGAEAPLGASLAGVSGQHASKPEIRGGFRQTIPLSFGNPNNAVYHALTADRLAVAVTEAVPFRIELEAPSAPLVRNGSGQLDVRVIREGDFKGQVDLWLIYDPPGVGTQKGVKVKPDQGRAQIALNANGKAALGRWPLVVIAKAGRRGPVWVSSQVRWLEVAEPLLGLTLGRSAGTQGTSAELVAQLELPVGFTGTGTARLVRMPQHTSAPTLTFDASATELRFPVAIAAEAKPGRHKNVFCQVVVQRDGQSIVHNLGNGELRVDAPQAAAPKPAPKPQPNAPAPASRLDQLRAEQAARATEEPGAGEQP